MYCLVCVQLCVQSTGVVGRMVQCTVYSVQCAVYSVQCAVCSVQCTVCSVQCAVYSVQCAVYSVQCTVYSVQCAVYSVEQMRIYEIVLTFMGLFSSFFLLKTPQCVKF